MASATHEPTSKGPEGPAGSAHERRALPLGRAVLERLISLREGSIIVVAIIVAIYFSANTSTFFTGSNFETLLPYFAPIAILAAGEVFVMILGEIDLSIGGMYMFAPIVYYKLDNAGLGLVASLVIALLICGVVGAVNGAFVSIVGVSSFVTTLGMLFTFEGLSLVLSHGTPVATPGAQVRSTTVQAHHVVNGHSITLPEKVNHIGTFAKLFGGGIYSELIWAVVIVLILQVVLTFTRWGLYTVAIGSNKLGAAEAGVKVKLVTIRNFVLCAVLAGLVGRLRGDPLADDPAGPLGPERTSADRDRGGGDRRHAALRRLGHGRGRVHRRALPRHPQGRPDPPGRQRELPAALHGHRDHRRDDRERVRRAGAKGAQRKWLTRTHLRREWSARSPPTRTCCASSTSPSASAR